jgi:hypothetical protein
MDMKKFTRKPFPVSAVQVSLEHIDEIAQWCKGTVVMRPTKMMGTYTDLPVIVLPSEQGSTAEASLGCWIVELKGSFRSYKPGAFEASFDEFVETNEQVVEDNNVSYIDEHTPSVHAS